MNRRLESMVDTKAINANPSTEFLSKVIEEAHNYRLEFVTNSAGILHHDIKREYLMFLQFHICCDDSQTRQFMRDQLVDLLKVYPVVDGIMMEHPDYPLSGCYCESTQQRYKSSKGGVVGLASERSDRDWANRLIAEDIAFVKSLFTK